MRFWLTTVSRLMLRPARDGGGDLLPSRQDAVAKRISVNANYPIAASAGKPLVC